MSTAREARVVLWEVDDMLGVAEKDDEGRPAEILLFPDVPGLLRDLCGASIRCGVKATCPAWGPNDLASKLNDAGIGQYFEPDMMIPFEATAAMMSGRIPPGSVLASVCHVRRSAFINAGFRAAPHRSLVREVVDGGVLTYIFVSAKPSRAVDGSIDDSTILPLYRPTSGPAGVYAVSTLATAETLRRKGYRVEEFGNPDEPAYTELFLLQVDDSAESKRFIRHVKDHGNTVRVLKSGLLVALKADQNITQFHPPDARHGHTLLLRPMDPPDDRQLSEFRVAAPASVAAAAGECNLPVLATGTLDPADAEVIKTIDAAMMEKYLGCWCGKDPLPGTSDYFVKSRFIDHPDNPAVAGKLKDTLGVILGSSATTPTFTYDNAERFNVEGRINGTDPTEVIVVGAHFDSIGAPDSAPGADDDASGVAGVLAVATVLKQLSKNKPPRRNIRFALFNAEEVGFYGSITYAKRLAAVSPSGKQLTPVAMIQMDMIGCVFGKEKDQAEIHPGGKLDFVGIDECVKQRTSELAALIAQEGTPVMETLTFETFPRPNEEDDPLGSLSDHHRFLIWANCPACLITENAFNAESKSIGTLNKVYHTKDDVFDLVSLDYAARIARAVAATVWVMANS